MNKKFLVVVDVPRQYTASALRLSLVGMMTIVDSVEEVTGNIPRQVESSREQRYREALENIFLVSKFRQDKGTRRKIEDYCKNALAEEVKK